MREILFRGQCEATNEWVYGLPVTETTLSNSISHISQYSGTERKFGRTNVKIKPESIGQFTGLLDKNGNKIFENDKTNIGVVLFENGCFGVKYEFNDFIPFELINLDMLYLLN